MAAPRVLVNAVSAHTGGGLTYAYEQLRALSHLPDVSLTVVATEPLAGRLAGECRRLEIISQPRRRLPLRIVWEQITLPRLAAHYDAVYLLGNFALFACQRPQIVALQNPNHFGAEARAVRSRVPEMRVRARLALESAVACASVRRATVAVAVSRTLHAAVGEDLGELPSLRTVLSAAPSLPDPDGACGGSYALMVGNDYPHKDWDGIIDAFARDSTLPPLLVVGRCRTRRRGEMFARSRVRNTNHRVRLVGSVDSRERLAALYRGATCFVAHSRLEAFPLTPFEALSLGLPVAASDITAHREVCGDLAFYYDPDDPASITRAVRQAAAQGRRVVSDLRTWEDNAAEVGKILVEAATP